MNESGINQEETLLEETASREAELVSTIDDLKVELKKVQQDISRLSVENEKLQGVATESSSQQELFDTQYLQMKKELKELKFRENRNLIDYSELEDENVTLQKQVCFQISVLPKNPEISF